MLRTIETGWLDVTSSIGAPYMPHRRLEGLELLVLGLLVLVYLFRRLCAGILQFLYAICWSRLTPRIQHARPAERSGERRSEGLLTLTSLLHDLRGLLLRLKKSLDALRLL